MESVRPILLVEDNPDDAELALHAWRANRIAEPVVVRADAASALAWLADPGEPLPRLVLLDLKLPGIPGLEVLRALRTAARTRLVPVVVLTTSREPRDVFAAYQLGANGYVVKPVELHRFTEIVRRIAAFWLEINEGPP